MIELTDISPLQDEADAEDGDFESPNGSKWIVAVDVDGLVSILRRPNIHYSFFDCGNGAEDVGLPPDVADTEAGVYEWTCDLFQSSDPETGYVDGHEFHVTDETLIWAVPE